MADEMLRDLASGISALMRTSDVVARRRRTGFALLLPESDIEGAELTIQRIHERLRRIEAGLTADGYNGPQPTVVAGSSTYPADGQNVAELILAADQRMLAQADELEIAAR
jgi:diguanylate cyclase (GGDEF)-like protein